MPKLERIRIAGYKSILDQTIKLRDLNVLIGANGSGKSNFIGAFKFLNRILAEELQLFIGRAGGADQLLHFGRKVTERIELEVSFRKNDELHGYQCSLVPSATDELVFEKEIARFQKLKKYDKPFDRPLGGGHKESLLSRTSGKATGKKVIQDLVIKALSSWRIFHFHDTSAAARIKQTANVDDNRVLRPDGGNLAAFLYFLQEREPARYANIRDTIRLVAPFFDDFDLEPERLNPEKIKLIWRERGAATSFGASALSDGTLRFIALATLLLQPELPSTVLIDEPELGLHPYAIVVLADLLRAAASRTQVIVSTQSVSLVNELDVDDLVIVDRENGASVLHRLDESALESWLEDYALGELWEKNVLGGRPAS